MTWSYRCGKGLINGEVSARLAEVYGAKVLLLFRYGSRTDVSTGLTLPPSIRSPRSAPWKRSSGRGRYAP